MGSSGVVIVLGVPVARLDAVERQVRGRQAPHVADEPEDRTRDRVREVQRVARVPGGRVLIRLVIATTGEHCAAQLSIAGLGAPGPAVVALARRWLLRHHLWLDPTPLEARCAALASGGSTPVVRRVSSAVRPGMGIDAAVREMVGGCLVQVLGNLGPLASGVGSAEHVHQARVAIRRARTVLRELGDSSAALDPGWSDGLTELFRALGTSRDREVVVSRWSDQLVMAGAPDLRATDEQVDDPAEVARLTAHGLLLLDLLSYALGQPADTEVTVEAVVTARLARLHQRLGRDARRFAEATVVERHATRKRLKRLRYLAELSAPLYRGRRVKRFLKEVEPAQTALGEFNDLAVAEAWFRSRVADDPAAWFAVGWLAAHQADAVAACVRPLRTAAEADPYWT